MGQIVKICDKSKAVFNCFKSGEAFDQLKQVCDVMKQKQINCDLGKNSPCDEELMIPTTVPTTTPLPDEQGSGGLSATAPCLGLVAGLAMLHLAWCELMRH